MGAYVKDISAGGIRSPDIQELLKCGAAGDPPVWSRDMVDVTQDWEYPGQVPQQYDLPAGKYVAKEVHDVHLDLPTTGRGYDGSGVGGGGDVRPPLPEYCCTLYCHSANTGYMPSGIVTYRSAGDDMVVSGRHQLRSGVDREGV